jgi:hypothetical protein
MKKLIIALSAMAIANFSFILPVKAQLVDEGEMYKAREYALWYEKQNRNIYVGYDVEEVAMFLATQSCKQKNLGIALEELKHEDYRSFVALLLLNNENSRYKELIKLITEVVCPEVKDIKF